MRIFRRTTDSSSFDTVGVSIRYGSQDRLPDE